MNSVIVFGPTGQVGSVTALTAAELGAKVWLAMRDTTKSIPGLTGEFEAVGDFQRIQADLEKPETVRQAVKTSSAKRAFLYLVHGATDHQKGAIKAMKEAGVEFVVFLSSFTIRIDLDLRDIPSSDLITYAHAQVEANLEDIFGPDNYVTVRPGSFITNLLQHKDGIAAGNVRLYGAQFEEDEITPGDIGRVMGNILVSGPRNGQKKVYLYGPELLSKHDAIVKMGRALGKEVVITNMGPEEGYDNIIPLYISLGYPPEAAKYMVEIFSTKGPDKGNGERFPYYEEGVSNVELYTGKPAMSIKEWVEENKTIFGA